MTIQDFNAALTERNSEQMRTLGELQEPRLLEAIDTIEPGRWLEWA